jgi:hypothetical protein
MTTFYTCKECGKILIERLDNGLFKFMFGKQSKSTRRPPVEMIIHGNIKMRCLRRNCPAWNVFNFLPTPNDWDTPTNEQPQSVIPNLRKSHNLKGDSNGT